MGLYKVESLFSPLQPARDPLRLEDAYVRLLRHRYEVVDDGAGDEAAGAPVVGEADVVDAAAVDVERRHARGDEGARGDRAARGADADDVAVAHARLRGELGRELGEELRLQLGEVR